MSKELQCLGVVPTSKKDNNHFQISNAENGKFMDGHGITKDVRKKLKEMEDDRDTQATNFLGATVLATKEDAVLEVGSGDGKLTYTMYATRDSRNPRDGAITKTYGALSKRRKGVVPSSIKKDVLPDWQEQIKKAMA